LAVLGAKNGEEASCEVSKYEREFIHYEIKIGRPPAPHVVRNASQMNMDTQIPPYYPLET